MEGVATIVLIIVQVKRPMDTPPEVLIVGGEGRGWGHCSCVFDMILYDDMIDGWG